MQQLPTIAELKSRAEAIGSSLEKLAIAAEIAPSTAYRGLNGDCDTGASKIRKLANALARMEHAALARLRELGADAGETAA